MANLWKFSIQWETEYDLNIEYLLFPPCSLKSQNPPWLSTRTQRRLTSTFYSETSFPFSHPLLWQRPGLVILRWQMGVTYWNTCCQMSRLSGAPLWTCTKSSSRSLFSFQLQLSKTSRLRRTRLEIWGASISDSTMTCSSGFPMLSVECSHASRRSSFSWLKREKRLVKWESKWSISTWWWLSTTWWC